MLPRITRAVDLLDGQGSASGQQPLWDVVYGSKGLQAKFNKWVGFIGAGVGTLMIQQIYKIIVGE